MNKEKLPQSPTEPYLPPHMRDAMNLYLEHGICPGGFLTAVLENDLTGACGRADHINLRFLTNIVSYCYNEIDHEAWGSPEKVAKWIKSFESRREGEDEQKSEE